MYFFFGFRLRVIARRILILLVFSCMIAAFILVSAEDVEGVLDSGVAV